MKKLLILLSFLILATTAITQEFNSKLTYVKLILVKCDDRCLAEDQALDVFARVQDFYKLQLNRDLYLSDFNTIKLKLKQEKVDTFGENRYHELRDRLAARGLLANAQKREVVLVIDQWMGYEDPNLMGFGGLSGLCYIGKRRDSDKDDISVAYLGYNAETKPELHLQAATSIIAHEIGHALGAWHERNTEQFMYPYLYAANTLQDPVAKITLEDINRCTTRRAYVSYKKCLEEERPKFCIKKSGLRNRLINKPEVFGEGIR
jgi:hypothetical protein